MISDRTPPAVKNGRTRWPRIGSVKMTAPIYTNKNQNMLEVLMIDPQQVVFEGKALRIVLPGEQGVFEIQKHHKRIISRLLTGNIDIDNRTYPIRRGLVTMEDDKVTIVIEP